MRGRCNTGVIGQVIGRFIPSDPSALRGQRVVCGRHRSARTDVTPLALQDPKWDWPRKHGAERGVAGCAEQAMRLSVINAFEAPGGGPNQAGLEGAALAFSGSVRPRTPDKRGRLIPGPDRTRTGVSQPVLWSARGVTSVRALLWRPRVSGS